MLRYVLLIIITLSLSSCASIADKMVSGMSSLSKGILELDSDNFSNFKNGRNPRIKKIVYGPRKYNEEKEVSGKVFMGHKYSGNKGAVSYLPLKVVSFNYNDKGQLIKQTTQEPNIPLVSKENYLNHQKLKKDIELIEKSVKTFSYDEEAQTVTVNEQLGDQVKTFKYQFSNKIPVALYEIVNGQERLIEEYFYNQHQRLTGIKAANKLFEIESGTWGRATLTETDLKTNAKTIKRLSQLNVKRIGAKVSDTGTSQTYTETFVDGKEISKQLGYTATYEHEHAAPQFHLEQTPSSKKFNIRESLSGQTIFYLQNADGQSELYDSYTVEFFYEKARGNAYHFNKPETSDEMLGLINMF